jgi:hypothetical protein
LFGAFPLFSGCADHALAFPLEHTCVGCRVAADPPRFSDCLRSGYGAGLFAAGWIGELNTAGFASDGRAADDRCESGWRVQGGTTCFEDFA